MRGPERKDGNSLSQTEGEDREKEKKKERKKENVEIKTEKRRGNGQAGENFQQNKTPIHDAAVSSSLSVISAEYLG